VLLLINLSLSYGRKEIVSLCGDSRCEQPVELAGGLDGVIDTVLAYTLTSAAD
jgi:hypothetical protein